MNLRHLTAILSRKCKKESKDIAKDKYLKVFHKKASNLCKHGKQMLYASMENRCYMMMTMTMMTMIYGYDDEYDDLRCD